MEIPEESSRRHVAARRRVLFALMVALLLFIGWLAGTVVRETLASMIRGERTIPARCHKPLVEGVARRPGRRPLPPLGRRRRPLPKEWRRAHPAAKVRRRPMGAPTPRRASRSSISSPRLSAGLRGNRSGAFASRWNTHGWASCLGVPASDGLPQPSFPLLARGQGSSAVPGITRRWSGSAVTAWERLSTARQVRLSTHREILPGVVR